MNTYCKDYLADLQIQHCIACGKVVITNVKTVSWYSPDILVVDYQNCIHLRTTAIRSTPWKAVNAGVTLKIDPIELWPARSFFIIARHHFNMQLRNFR